MELTKNIEVLTHASIRITGEKTIYCDPFKVKENYKDADIVLITHEHFDHYSPEDIAKVAKEETILVVPESMKEQVPRAVTIQPGETKTICGIEVMAIPAYNVGKPFHTKDKEWVGYIIKMDDNVIYIAGDTDINEDNLKVNCKVALVPIGGTYTMDAQKAAEFVNTIKPEVAIPVHYGSVAGDISCEKVFIDGVDEKIKVEVKVKEY